MADFEGPSNREAKTLRRVRVAIVALACGVLSLAASARADEPPTDAAKAADAVVAAVGAHDAKALATLAAASTPNPWDVVEELAVRGAPDAATAFAAAARRPDTDGLPAYVAWRREHPGDPKLWDRAVRASERLKAGGLPAEALASLEGLDASGEGITSIAVIATRVFALYQLGRYSEAEPMAADLLARAEPIGELRRAAWAAEVATMCAYLLHRIPAMHGYATRRVAIQERRGLKAEVAAALGSLALALESLGDPGAALSMQRKSLAIFEEIGDKAGIARALLNIGILEGDRGQRTEAIADLGRSSRLFHEVGDAPGEITALRELGAFLRATGEVARSRAVHAEALALAESMHDGAEVSATLQVVAVDRTSSGDYAEALRLLDRALEIDAGLGERGEPDRILMSMGVVHLHTGEWAKARDVLERALTTLRTQPPSIALANALEALAEARNRLGEPETARALLAEALVIVRGLRARPLEARILSNVGALEAEAGDPKAAATYQAAIEILREVGDREGEAGTLGSLGAVLSRAGQGDRAVELFEQARTIAAAVGATYAEFRIDEAHAAFLENAGRHREALDRIGRIADRATRLVRGLSDQEASSARAGLSDLYRTAISAAVALGDVGEAFRWFEASRAGALIESLSSRAAISESMLPPALREAEEKAAAAEAVARTSLRTASMRHDEKAATGARADLDRAQAELLGVVARIEREAKAAADVLYPRPAALKDVQALLKPGDALVLYSLAETKAYALVVTAKDARAVVIGERAAVVAACDALLSRSAPFVEASQAGPVRERIVAPLALGPTVRRVLVSPDGILAFVPFSLLDPDREVVFVPSGTTYALLASQVGARGDGVLALGDPDYGTRPASRPAIALRSGEELTPLPATRDEAKAVGSSVLLGKDATRAKLWTELAKHARWRAVHFACHGLFDAAVPSRSALALSPTDTDDGLLSMLDVVRTRVPADLVVLSACETGRGKDYRGEGIMGPTRAFMLAGTPRVLASLWKVDDRATRLLMEAFYDAWGKRGVAASTALREAQRVVREHEEKAIDLEASRRAGHDVLVVQRPFAAPPFWAGWVLWGLPE